MLHYLEMLHPAIFITKSRAEKIVLLSLHFLKSLDVYIYSITVGICQHMLTSEPEKESIISIISCINNFSSKSS